MGNRILPLEEEEGVAVTCGLSEACFFTPGSFFKELVAGCENEENILLLLPPCIFWRALSD